MAFRSAASTTGANAASPGACNLPAGIQVGDYLLAMWSIDTAGAANSPTVPTGWTKLSGPTDITGPDTQTYVIYGRVADGNESTQRTWSGFGGNNFACIIGAWSGRGTTPTFVANSTPNTSGNPSPVSVALTGGTAAAGDDLAWFVALDNEFGASTWAIGTPPSGFTSYGVAQFQWGTAALAYRDNVSAGATGTITGTLTEASDLAGWSGFVVALPAAGGGGGSTIDVTPSDTAAVTDSTGTASTYGRLPSDTASVSDSVATSTVYVRSASDTASVTDAVGPEVGKSPSDSVSVTDGASLALVYDRDLTETAVVADSAGTALVYERTPSADAVSVTDSVSAGLFRETDVSLSDTITVTDGTSLSSVYERAASETLTVTDGATLSSIYERTPSADAVAVTDVATATVSGSHTILVDVTGDPVGVTDTLSEQAQYVRSGNDTIAASDTSSVSSEYARTGSDTASVTDTIARSTEYGRALSDAPALTDQLITLTSYQRMLSDALMSTDAVTAFLIGSGVSYVGPGHSTASVRAGGYKAGVAAATARASVVGSGARTRVRS